MAKRKTAEPVITLHRDVLPNGNIYLTSPNRIYDIRDNSIYSEVICLPQDERFYREVEIDTK